HGRVTLCILGREALATRQVKLSPDGVACLPFLDPRQPDLLGGQHVGKQTNPFTRGLWAITQRLQNHLVGPDHRAHHSFEITLHTALPAMTPRFISSPLRVSNRSIHASSPTLARA